MKDEPEVIRVYQEQIVKWGMIYQSRAVSLSQGGRDRAVRMVLQGVSWHGRYGQ